MRIPVTLTDNDDNKNAKLSERMFLWDPTYKRSTAMVIGTPFTLSSGGAAAEIASINHVKLTATAGISGIVNCSIWTRSAQCILQQISKRMKHLAQDQSSISQTQQHLDQQFNSTYYSTIYRFEDNHEHLAKYDSQCKSYKQCSRIQGIQLPQL